MPLHGGEETTGRLAQAGIDGDRAPQARARPRGPEVAQPLVREPHHRLAVVVQREHALAPPADQALDHGPEIPLPRGEGGRFERRGIGHVLRAVVRDKALAVPEVREPGLENARVSDRGGGRVALGERRRDARRGDPHAAGAGQLQGARLVERGQQHVGRTASHRDADLLPLGTLGSAQHAGALSLRQHDVDRVLVRPVPQRRERRDVLSVLTEPGTTVARPSGQRNRLRACHEYRRPGPSERPYAGERLIGVPVEHEDAGASQVRRRHRAPRRPAVRGRAGRPRCDRWRSLPA